MSLRQLIKWKDKDILKKLRKKYDKLGWNEENIVKAIMLAFLYGDVDISRELYIKYSNKA